MTIECISLTLSIAAFLGSIFTYFKHDRILKRQEKKLNEYQLQKIEQEQEDNKKAVLRAELQNAGSNKRNLQIANVGLSTAKNVRLRLSDDTYPKFLLTNPFPYSTLHANEKIDLSFTVDKMMPRKIIIVLQWADDFQQDNRFEQAITF